MLKSAIRTGCAAIALAGLSGSAFAQLRSVDAPRPITDPRETSTELAAREAFLGSRVAFAVDGNYSHFVVTIAGPENYEARAFNRNRAPAITLQDFGEAPDGLYTYEITAASFEYGPPSRLNDGRQTSQLPRIGVSRSGSFRVSGGQIVPTTDAAEEN